MPLDYRRDAERFARERHAGQMYGEHPFAYHLAAVEAQLRAFGHDDDALLAAAWLHDVVEDTPTTIEEIAHEFGSDVAALVLGVTDIVHDEQGVKLPNRLARQTATYARLCWTATNGHPRVVMLKLADRLANMEASLAGINTRHLSMYLTEHPFFCRSIGHVGGDPKMWSRLDKLVRRGYEVYHAPPTTPVAG